MTKTFTFALLFLFQLHLISQIDQAAVKEFAQSYSSKKNISLAEVEAILNSATYKEEIIAKISRPAEGTMTWEHYRKIFMTDERIAAGVAFEKVHRAHRSSSAHNSRYSWRRNLLWAA
jgi:membrane-bound lytic murein transglycosylase B